MTGIGGVMTDTKKERIAKLTKEGLPNSTISERTGINQQQIYNYQIKVGLREKVKRGTIPSKRLTKDLKVLASFPIGAIVKEKG